MRPASLRIDARPRTKPLERRLRSLSATLLVAAFAPDPLGAQENLLAPPPVGHPIRVLVGVEVLDVVEVDDSRKTIQIEGLLTVRWQDERLRFDPAEVGSPELVYSGDYQFSEIATGWWPQLALRNEAGLYSRQGQVLRVQPDGSCRYQEEFQAIAEVPMDLQLIPFDDQVFELVFEVVGFGASEVRLEPDPDWTAMRSHASVRQWNLGSMRVETADYVEPMLSGRERDLSAVVFRFPASRDPGFILRSIVLPLLILVALSWSVFWMDSAQLSDRMTISFTGILTVVAFQIVVSDMLPRIPYFTILSSFLLISYLMLVASVIVNLRVGQLDRSGRVEPGNRLDRSCRWLFPLGYVGVNLAMAAFYFLTY